MYSSLGAGISSFDVNKNTRRCPRSMPRQMLISEKHIIEKDASGFKYVSFRRISSVYAIVRSWKNPREFTIEYDDGTCCTYTCPVRDTLLAMLLDIAHSTGNSCATVTGEVSDYLRLMPRFAEEHYENKLMDSIFGSDSIEAWFLRRLERACASILGKVASLPGQGASGAQTERGGLVVAKQLMEDCEIFNANVPCPGVGPSIDASKVRCCMSGVLVALQALLMGMEKPTHNFSGAAPGGGGGMQKGQAVSALPFEMSLGYNINFGSVDLLEEIGMTLQAAIVLLVQTLVRLVPCPEGYKGFVEVQEVDTRVLILKLVTFDDDFVNYWAMELLSALCKANPASSGGRNAQQEFVNKHALLTDGMLTALVDLLSSRGDVHDIGVEPTGEDASSGAPAAAGSGGGGEVGWSRADAAERSDSRMQTAMSSADSCGDGFPNSLVIVGAAVLLESVLASNRDTSSPELMNKVLDLFAGRHEILTYMLRSKSFLIMENAAVLLHILLKNRAGVCRLLQEAALSEALVIRHFFDGVFSPSSNQRFISRFLFASWAASVPGDTVDNPAKALLRRMVPSGLLEYLRYAPLSAERREDLDETENEYFAGVGGGASSPGFKAIRDNVQARMRARIADIMRQPPVAKSLVAVASIASSGSSGGSGGGSGIGIGSGSGSGQHNPRAALALTPPPRGVNSRSNSAEGPGSGSGLALSAGAGAGAESGGSSGAGPENFRVMFHVMIKDHRLPDLIWNEQTRMELRHALESELTGFELEQMLRGAGKVAWNYQQFHVRYDSLREELRVGPIYLRHFLDAPDAFIRGLQTPSHGVLFEKLLRRVLVNVEKNSDLAVVCTRCLSRLYGLCKDAIGHFDDMMISVRMLERASNMELQHWLLVLLEQLTMDPSNLEQLLDRDFVELAVGFASLAHLNPTQIGNMLARAANQQLLLQATSATASVPLASTSPPAPTERKSDSQRALEPTSGDSERKRALWVPQDSSCPPMWFVAPPAAGQLPPAETQLGPFLVSELIAQVDGGSIKPDQWFAAPASVEDYDASEVFSLFPLFLVCVLLIVSPGPLDCPRGRRNCLTVPFS
jgi:hypothetical protein